MKKTIFAGLMFLSMPALGTTWGIPQTFKDKFCALKHEFCKAEDLTHEEQVVEAIREGNVRQVLRLVKEDNTTQPQLEHYIKVANEYFGLAPKAKLKAKIIGALKVGLGLACVYKTWDHYNEKYKIWENRGEPKNIWDTIYKRFTIGDIDEKGNQGHGPLHYILVDIATIASFLSAQGGIYAAFNAIKPKCDLNNHLLIRLYLKNLVKTASQTSPAIQAA